MTGGDDYVTRRELLALIRLAKTEMAIIGFLAIQIFGLIVWGVVLLWR
jgi:hypothetical protein